MNGSGRIGVMIRTPHWPSPQGVKADLVLMPCSPWLRPTPHIRQYCARQRSRFCPCRHLK
jgi:hypothetical protein